ncbi:MAG TPA: phosphopantothenoylcysteine decarboxylase, partial [Tissierellaceae bacterium]
MFDAVGRYFDDCDILIKSAAPSDYKPVEYSDIKIKKKDEEDESLNIELTRNPDILKFYGNNKEKQVVIGFAAETNDLYENAKMKVQKKNLDFIVANDVTKEGAGFKTDTNIVSIIDHNGNTTDYPIMDKVDLANIILDKALEIIK